MNILQKISKKFALVAIALFAATLVVTTGTASARTPYNENGTATSATPVLNEFYDVPGVGDEADFVRVKPKAGANGAYVDTLTDACATGSTFNVRTYVHNGAAPSYNNEGAGSAVAHDVTVALKAELGTAKSKFEFKSTVASSNMAGGSDTAYLNCGSKTVKLSLVPSSVQTYSKPIGFNTEADSVVNGAPFRIGSRAHGSGDQWACWDDRIIVVYEVKVEDVPVVISSDAVCTLDGGKFIVIDNKKRTVKGGIKPQLTNAVVTGYKIDWGDGTTPSTNQNDTHSYKDDGEYTIQSSYTVKAINGGKFADGSTEKLVSGANCATKVKFETGKPPVVTPPTVVPPTVTRLTATGPASTFAIFAAVSILGAFMHRAYMARKAAIQE